MAAAKAAKAATPSVISYRYTVMPYGPSLSRFNWLHVTVWVHGFFLYVCAFLAFLQAQGVEALPNLWAFVVSYSVIGVTLVVVHLLALLWYLNRYTELSNATALVAKVTFSSFLVTWFFTLLTSGAWVQNYGGACCEAPLVNTSDLQSWALYNNALSLASIVVFTLPPIFILSATYHFRPERQTPIAVEVKATEDEDEDEDGDV